MSYTELRGNALIDWTIRDQRERQARMKDGDLSIMECRLREQGIAHAELGRLKGGAATALSCGKPVKLGNTEYPSISAAARAMGMTPSGMRAWLRRRG